MALIQGDFKEVGGPGNNGDGGQVYSLRSTTDTLETMMASAYLDTIEDKIASDDVLILSGTDGCQMVQAVNTAGVITMIPITSAAGAVEAVAGGGGAAALTPEISDITSTGADVITLANGTYIGQKKTLIHAVDGGSAIITPATTVGAWSTCTLLAAGDTCQLQWNGTGWVALGVGAGTVNLPVFA